MTNDQLNPKTQINYKNQTTKEFLNKKRTPNRKRWGILSEGRESASTFIFRLESKNFPAYLGREAQLAWPIDSAKLFSPKIFSSLE